MSTSSPQKDSYTIEDIYELPDGVRAELIDGKICYMAFPSSEHQRLVSRLCHLINNCIDETAGFCEVYPAPFAVFLNRDDRNYVEPDLSVICDPDKISVKGCEGAPDWIIEILSPSSLRMDCYIKLFKYRSAGVREYWIVDDQEKLVTVYRFSQDDCLRYSFSEPIPAGIFPDLTITIDDISRQNQR